MIDPNTEQLLSLPDAAALVPPRRASKNCARSTVYRWTTAGCRGVILESVQIGGTRCTSKEAMARFYQRLTDLPLPTRYRNKGAQQ